MSFKVTVIGTGRMGSALATALFRNGCDTTVWNRTASKTEALSKLGVKVASTLAEAVEHADIVVVNISDYNSTRQLFHQTDIEKLLCGKIVVQLSTGIPQEARKMEAWARGCGIHYLDGAILGSPGGVGTPACTMFYSGPEEVFHRAKPILSAFGERTLFVGNEIGHAAAFDLAILTFGVSSMLGFLQGQVVWEAEGLAPGGFLETIKGMMPTLELLFADMSRRIATKDYRGDQASLEAYAIVVKQLVSWLEDRRSEHRVPDAFASLMDHAIHAGKSQADLACLFEFMAAPSRKTV